MPLALLNLGTNPNDNTGSNLRAAGAIINAAIAAVNAMQLGTQAINNQGASYTLALGDVGNLVVLTGDGATLNIPTYTEAGFPVGAWADILFIPSSSASTGAIGPEGSATIGGQMFHTYPVWIVFRIIQVAIDSWAASAVPAS